MSDLMSDTPTEFDPRYILNLIVWMTDTSALKASVSGGVHHRGWGMDRYLLRAIQNGISTNTVVTAKAAAGKKARSVKSPKMWPGPDEIHKTATTPKPKLSLADFARNLTRRRR
ncbi:hypothetical protein GCM10022234_00120 [Aeromicrobium panaciterrae]